MVGTNGQYANAGYASGADEVQKAGKRKVEAHLGIYQTREATWVSASIA